MADGKLNIADRNAIQAAARLIEKKGWTQGAPARSATGERLDDARSPEATCYCLLGSLMAVSEDRFQYERLYNAVYHANKEVLGDRLLWIWNDFFANHAGEVTAAIRRAAA